WEKSEGDRRLTAYVVAAAPTGHPGASIETWREGHAGILPAYMVPNEYILLRRLPLNPNLKIDRAALPPPDSAKQAVAARIPVHGIVTEQALSKSYSEVVEVEIVGAVVSFFTLGGRSLLATRVIARLADTFKAQLPRIEFYALPTVTGVANRIEQKLSA